jgi:hypothetical protein
MEQLSNTPLPLKSRSHCPVLGRNTPILATKELVVVWLLATKESVVIWLLATDCWPELFDTVAVTVFSAVELFPYTALTLS